MHFLVVVGSTREGRKTIHAAEYAAKTIEKEGHEAELFDLKEKDIPFMKERRRYLDEVPEDVEEFGQKVEDTDCLVIVCPEYNHSIPGVLKNALDYLYPEYNDKPFSYITTSAGGFGGVRGLSHLHDFTLAVGGIPGPNLPISSINSVFDSDGELQDSDYKDRFADYVEDIIEHSRK